MSRTPHACTAGPQQRDGGAHACYKGNSPSGEAWAIVADLHQNPWTGYAVNQLSRGYASYIRPKRRHASEPCQSVPSQNGYWTCWRKFRMPTLRLGAGHSCRFRVATARTLNCLSVKIPSLQPQVIFKDNNVHADQWSSSPMCHIQRA